MPYDPRASSSRASYRPKSSTMGHLENEGLDPPPEGGRVEIDEEADLLASDPEGGQDGSPVDGLEALHALRLHHDLIVDEQIQSLLPDFSPFVDHRYEQLPLIVQSEIIEFDTEGGLAGRFQESRTELAMHGDRGSD